MRPDSGSRVFGKSQVRPVVLAAGASSRYGSDKLLVPVDGVPMLARVLDTLAALGKTGWTSQPVVVVGPGHDRRAALARACGASIVVSRWPGIGGSLRTAAVTHRNEPLLLCLGDMPWLEPRVLYRLLRSWHRRPCDIIRPVHGSHKRPGHPVLIAAHRARELESLVGDSGLRPERAAVRQLRVGPGGQDVDRPGDLERRGT